jgi:hydrogenase nickel incorporation protein HypA/HybF
MHEWALAESVVDFARREAGGRRVLRVDLRLGELQQVDPEVFGFALRELAAESGIEPGAFRISPDPAAFSCRRCGRSWPLADGAALSDEEREAVHFLPESALVYGGCPGCGSRDFEITSGRGVWIAEMEVEEAEGGEGNG